MAALSGLGGNELFGDYRSFWRAPRLARIGALIRTPALGARLRLASLINAYKSGSRVAKVRTFLSDKPSFAGNCFALRSLFDDSHIARLIDCDLASAGRRQFATFSHLSGYGGDDADSDGAVSLLELQAHMCGQLLRDTGAMSMAHGVEVRCPLVDHELIEFLAALPPGWRFRGRPKELLLCALGDTIAPAAVRRPKTGFTLPLGNWLQGDLGSAIRELLDKPSDIIDRGFMLGLWADFRRGHLHWSGIWAIVMLHLWLQEFRQAVSNVSADAGYADSLTSIGEPPPASA